MGHQHVAPAQGILIRRQECVDRILSLFLFGYICHYGDGVARCETSQCGQRNADAIRVTLSKKWGIYTKWWGLNEHYKTMIYTTFPMLMMCGRMHSIDNRQPKNFRVFSRGLSKRLVSNIERISQTNPLQGQDHLWRYGNSRYKIVCMRLCTIPPIFITLYNSTWVIKGLFCTWLACFTSKHYATEPFAYVAR